MSSRGPSKPPEPAEGSARFDDKKPALSVDGRAANDESTPSGARDPVLGVPVKDWNLFRAFCRELGVDADRLRHLADDRRRLLMAPEMGALMTELYQRGFCDLNVFEAYWHEHGMIACEDPRPSTPEEQVEDAKLYARCFGITSKSPDEVRAERQRRRTRKPT